MGFLRLSPGSTHPTFEHRFDALRQREEPAVGAMLADHHQPHGWRARLLYREGDGAAVEEVDDRWVAQDQRVEVAVILVALEGGERRCGDRDGRHQECVER